MPPCATQVLINCHHLPHFSPASPPRCQTHTHWHKAPMHPSVITRTIAEPQKWEMGRQRERATGWRNKWVGPGERAYEENKWQQTLFYLVFYRHVETVCHWQNHCALKGLLYLDKAKTDVSAVEIHRLLYRYFCGFRSHSDFSNLQKLCSNTKKLGKLKSF